MSKMWEARGTPTFVSVLSSVSANHLEGRTGCTVHMDGGKRHIPGNPESDSGGDRTLAISDVALGPICGVTSLDGPSGGQPERHRMARNLLWVDCGRVAT